MEVGSSMQGSRCTSAEVDTQVPISFSPLLTGRSGFAKSERGQGNTDAHNSNLAITALVSRMSEHQSVSTIQSVTEENKSSSRSSMEFPSLYQNKQVTSLVHTLLTNRPGKSGLTGVHKRKLILPE